MTTSDTFPTSGKPTYLEWYKCYQDPSKDTWIDGQERLKLTNKDQQERWDFFYRPIRALVGRPQRHQIKILRKENKQIREELNSLTRQIFICRILGLTLPLLGAIIDFHFATIIFFTFVFFSISTYVKKGKINKSFKHNNSLISEFENEIFFLINQIPPTPKQSQADQWLDELFKVSELKALREITHTPQIEFEDIGDYIAHEPISKNGVQGLLIDCWGLLQPQQTYSASYGWEQTGFSKVLKDLDSNIATWRRKSNGSPYYRVIYMQHIFLLEKNINVYGFFYDFITGKKYGKREETFLYGHITNFNIKDVELGKDTTEDIQLGVPNALMDGLAETTFEALTLTVSSGVNFRCVLTTDTVIESINEWLELEKKHKEIKLRKNKEISNNFEENKKLSKKWALGDHDDLELEDIEKQVVTQKMQLANDEMSMVNRVIQQVRLRVATPPQMEVVEN